MLKYQLKIKIEIFSIDWFSKITLKSITKNIHNFALEVKCTRFKEEIKRAEKLGFEVER